VCRRLLLDNDGSNFFLGAMTEDIEGSVAEAVAECPENVTTYLLCAGAGTHYYPTEVSRVVPRADRLLAAHARGKDPFGMFLEALREAGKETFITLRMNDVHHPDKPDAGNIPRIKVEHPDCVVDIEAVREKRGGWMAHCLDYSRPEVRAYFLGIIGELAERYEFDGLQLDWMRFPRHLSGAPEEVWEKRECLTEFTAAVRDILRAGGRRRLLAARIPPHPAGWRFMGLDPAAWTRRGLVDFLVACPFLTTDFHMPIGEMRRALGEGRVPIYGGFDFAFGTQVHTPESLRAAASGLYACGADGVYVFNFPCWRERIGSVPYHWLKGLETPESAAAKPLLFAVAHRRRRVAGADLPAPLPAALPAGGALAFELFVPERVLPAARAIATLQTGGDVALRANGRPAREHPALRRAELFVEYAPRPRPGRPPRPADEDCRLFYVEPDALSAGENRFEVHNTSGGDLTVDRLNLGLW